ncbi:MAG TPA: MFS transporter [Gaiellaceae bacterium]|nr:MFS transporter [Gaiellaceae bacterium]
MKLPSLLSSGPLRALLAAEVISTSGSQMTWLALPWFVLTTSGSATRMSFVVAAEVIGMGLMTLPGSRLLSHFGARRTMLVCDGFRAPLIVLIPGLYWVGALSFPLLIAIALAVGAMTAPYFAAQKVILPELIGEDEEVLTQASALTQASTRVTMLLGPVLAGVLIAVIGAPSVLIVDGVTYVVAVLLVAGFVPRRPPLEVSEESRGIGTAVRFILREPLLRIWNPALAIGDMAWTAFFVTVPVLVVARFGADARIAGFLLASFGVGALVGNAVSFKFARRVEAMKLIATFIIGQALPLWLLTLPVPAVALCAALAFSGIANGIVNPPIHATMTLRIPPALRATVMPAMMLTWTILQPLGLFTAGPVLDAFGAKPVLIAFATIQTLMMAAVALACLRVRPRAASSAALPAGSS